MYGHRVVGLTALAVALAVCALVGAASGIGSTSAVKTSWVETDLGTLGGFSSVATAVNAGGEVVGWSGITQGTNVRHAFLWRNGGLIDLGVLPSARGGDRFTEAELINDHEQIVGTSNGQAFLWQNGQMTALRPPRGYSDVEPTDINEHGQVVGVVTGSGSVVARAFLWQDGQMTILGTLGGDYSAALAINDAGQVVGYAYTHRDRPRAFLWQNGQMTNLGTMPGGTGSWAYDINERGEIVGGCQARVEHACRWADGTLSDLGQLPGAGPTVSAEAWTISEDGAILVGSSVRSGRPGLGSFLWQQGTVIPLQGVAEAANGQGQIAGEVKGRAAIWEQGQWTQLSSATRSDAYAINDQGEAVGAVHLAEPHRSHAVVWLPQP